jgi:dephospho-CoA kinase
MHPLIRAEAARRVAEAEAAGASVVVYDMPLLVETGQQDLVDLVVVVDASEEQQVLRASCTWPEADVRRRMAVQANREERLAIADVVIDNGGDFDQTRRQVDEFWERHVGERA